MRRIVFFVMLTALSSTAAKRIPQIDEREAVLSELRHRLAGTRDSLQHEIAERWKARREAVELRETDKEEANRFAEEQEKLFNAEVNQREEGFALEREIETIRKTEDDRRQEFRYIATVLNEIMDREAQSIPALFPSDIDSAWLSFKELRSGFGKGNDPCAVVQAFAKYGLNTLRSGKLLGSGKSTLLPEGEEARPMTVTRFGSVFGYAMSEEGGVYVIGQSGREGTGRYRIRRVENPGLLQWISERFGNWVAQGRVEGCVMMDIMQSDVSGVLVSGKSETLRVKILRFIRAGGPVMVPLGLLPIWALVIVLLKLTHFFGLRSSARKLFFRVVSLFERGEKNEAAALCDKSRGPAAAAAAACIAPSSRKGAETAAREVLSRESSRLGSHLNTLAVIAGIAPLLGLLGTVTGMIRLFDVITRFGTGDPKLLAEGISEALITTEVGLIIAVPVMLIHNYLRNRKNDIIAELHLGVMRIINRLHPEV